MHTPECSHAGSHIALGSKTNPTTTPRGASEPAEQTPERATKATASTTEPRAANLMVGSVLAVSRERRKEDRQTDELLVVEEKEEERPSPDTDTSPRRPRCCAPEHPDRGNAGGGSSGGGRPVCRLCWLLITRAYWTRSRLGSLGLKVLLQKLYQERYIASN